jgi:cobalt-zinc-cadmium efflux system outer membrane protein
MKRAAAIAGALLAASCASVSRDAGVADVERAVAMHSHQTLTWRADAAVPPPLHGEISADEAVAFAMANSSRLQASLAEVGIARADLIEASTISNPLFEAELRLPGDPYRAYELRVAQSLVDLIQLPRRRALGRAVFDAAQMRVTSSVLRFGADVRAAYFDAVAATRHVEMRQTIVEAARAAAEVALKQHGVGNITDLDLEIEQARYEDAKLSLSRAERDLALAREELARMMGAPDASTWTVAPVFPALSDTELDQSQLERAAAAQRLDITIARREVDIAQRRVPVARLAALGGVTADIHYEREPNGARTVGPGIELPIPIFNSGRGARTRAEAEFLRARHRLNALLSESSSMLRSARASLVEARSRVEYHRDVVLPRRKRIVELTKLEHNAMLVGIFNLLEARKSEAQAESDAIEAQREYWTARVNLDRALQGISRVNGGND